MQFNFSEYRPRRIIRRHHQGILPADILRNGRVALSLRRIILDFYMSGINGRQAAILNYLEELRSLIWFMINVTNIGNSFRLRTNLRQKYRDYERSYYTGKLAEAIAWAFFRRYHGARYISDTRFYLNRLGFRPTGRQSLSDFCFIRGNVLNIFEVKGSWPMVSTDGVKSKIIKAHLQNIQTRNYLNNNFLPLGKSHICSISCSSSNFGWDSEIHYVDPSYHTSRELDFREKKTLENIYYSGWFRWVGLNKVADAILADVDADYDENMNEIIEHSDVQTYDGRSFYIFRTEKLSTPLSQAIALMRNELFINDGLILDYSDLKFGISTDAVRSILNPNKLLSSDNHDNAWTEMEDDKLEISSDRTIILGILKPNEPFKRSKPKEMPSPQSAKEEYMF